MITDNERERDVITVLEWLITATHAQPTDRIAFAMKRLTALLPQPEVVDTRPDGERRAEHIEKVKGPRSVNKGMVMPPPEPTVPDGEARRDFLERLKRPSMKGL